MENVDMMAEQVEDLMRQADSDGTDLSDRVQLLATAIGLTVDPLRQLELLMLVADAAGRAAHHTVTRALHGDGRPDRNPATWTEVGAAAHLTKDTAFRQYHGGAALSWSTRSRGVRQAVRRPATDGEAC